VRCRRRDRKILGRRVLAAVGWEKMEGEARERNAGGGRTVIGRETSVLLRSVSESMRS